MNKEEEKRDNENYSKNFTRIPNILFASYSKLTKEEKFLYCSLRQVYWDMKPRFVSLRELSELTGYATGTLSKMLPRLHTCGLIHSEIRKEKGKDGKEKGNSKYHITIPDIWELNREFFACSPEKRRDLDPSLKLDLPMKPVHQMNKLETCSPNEQTCSPNDTSLFTKCDKPVHQMNKFIGLSEPEEPRDDGAKDITKDTLKKESKSPTDVPSISLSSEEQRFYHLWSQKPFSVVEPKITPTLKSHCATLAPHILTKEQLTSLITFAREDDHVPTGKPVKLGNLVNSLNGWLQIQSRTSQPQKKPLSLAERNRLNREKYGIGK